MDTSYLENNTIVLVGLVLTVALPLCSSLLSFLIPERYSWLTILVAPLLLMIAAIFSVVILFNMWGDPDLIINLQWLKVGRTSISANLALSKVSLLMMCVVSIISFVVHLYSIGYMAGDGGVRKYFGMLGLFTFAMLGIVLTDNLMVMFIFWELVGFSSYLLIGHWNEKVEAGNAATKAFLMNRIGDVALLAGLMIVWTKIGTFEISTIVQQTSFEWQTVAALCIYVGAIGKSAQFPLFTWLPDAMQGPTPVSALIHAATMVAAGVYMLIRLFPIFDLTSLVVVACVGGVTALLGAVAALFQTDIKKVLAYSTMSQLGLMILAIGMDGPDAAFLHLLTHAFFKAGLFLCAGLVIHALHYAHARSSENIDVQDLRMLGGLRKRLPVTFVFFLICACSIVGLPFFSGFLSKEAIFATVLQSQSSLSTLMLVIVSVVSVLTVAYMVRLTVLVFFGKPRSQHENVKEGPAIMRFAVGILAALSIWLTVSWNPFSFKGWIFSDSMEVPNWLLPFSIVLVLSSVVGFWFLFIKPRFVLSNTVINAYGVDNLYRATVTNLTLRLSALASYTDSKILDGAVHGSAYGHVTLAHVVGWIDKFFVDGSVRIFAAFARWVGGFVRSYQTGKIQDYILWAVMALIIFLIWAL